MQLNRIPQVEGCVAQILVKLEGMNPAASVKDRIGANMIRVAEEKGIHSTRRDHFGRANLWQYRDCAGNGRRRKRVSLDFNDA